MSVEESITVPGDTRSVRVARRLTTKLCDEAGVDADLCDSAVLLVSELVTNAVTHGRSEARLHLIVDPDRVRVEVSDDNSRPPVLQTEDAEALDGRGVQLLDVLAAAWGVREERFGKTVWCEVRA